MAETIKRLCSGNIGDELTTLYTVPASTKAVVKSISMCNTITSTIKVTVQLDNICLLLDHDIAPGETLLLSPLDHVLEEEETLKVQSDSANSLAVYVSGRELT
jgi:hypothetical protein